MSSKLGEKILHETNVPEKNNQGKYILEIKI